MYPEVTEFLKRVEAELNLSLPQLSTIEHILFECWENGYEEGFRNSLLQSKILVKDILY